MGFGIFESIAILIEKNYDRKISGMYLVALHPNNENYQKIKVIDLQSQVKALVEEKEKNMMANVNS